MTNDCVKVLRYYSDCVHFVRDAAASVQVGGQEGGSEVVRSVAVADMGRDRKPACGGDLGARILEVRKW